MMIRIFLKNCENFHWDEISPDFLITPSLSEKLEHIKANISFIKNDKMRFSYLDGNVKYISLLDGVIDELEKALMVEYDQEIKLLKDMFLARIKHLPYFQNDSVLISIDDWFSTSSVDNSFFLFVVDDNILKALVDECEFIKNKVKYLNQVKHNFNHCLL